MRILRRSGLGALGIAGIALAFGACDPQQPVGYGQVRVNLKSVSFDPAYSGPALVCVSLVDEVQKKCADYHVNLGAPQGWPKELVFEIDGTKDLSDARLLRAWRDGQMRALPLRAEVTLKGVRVEARTEVTYESGGGKFVKGDFDQPDFDFELGVSLKLLTIPAFEFVNDPGRDFREITHAPGKLRENWLALTAQEQAAESYGDDARLPERMIQGRANALCLAMGFRSSLPAVWGLTLAAGEGDSIRVKRIDEVGHVETISTPVVYKSYGTVFYGDRFVTTDHYAALFSGVICEKEASGAFSSRPAYFGSTL